MLDTLGFKITGKLRVSKIVAHFEVSWSKNTDLEFEFVNLAPDY